MPVFLKVQYTSTGQFNRFELKGQRYTVGTFQGMSAVEEASDRIELDFNLAPASRPEEFTLTRSHAGDWVLGVEANDPLHPYKISWIDEATHQPTEPQPLGWRQKVRANVDTKWRRQNLIFEIVDVPLEELSVVEDIEWMQPVLNLEVEIHKELVDRGTELLARDGVDLKNNKDAFDRELELLLDQKLFTQDHEVVSASVELALKRGLTVFVSSTDPRKGNAPTDDDAPIFELPEPRKVAKLILDDLKLSLEVSPKHKILEDVKRLEEGFRDSYARFKGRLGTRDLQTYARLYFAGTVSDRVFKFGPLTELLEVDAVNDIMVINFREIYLDRLGRVERYPFRFTDDKELKDLIRKILKKSGRDFSTQHPIVDVRLDDGSRVHAAQEPAVLPLRYQDPDPKRRHASTSLTIRKFPDSPVTFDQLVEWGSLTEDMRTFLQDCVRLRKNIVVSGGTGSGKTTLLNCLSSYCQENHRIVTIEDTAELRLVPPHVVSMETVKATADNKDGIDIAALVRSSLRMRPDRIFVGECRGAEALDMLQAMNTGHSGSMTTAHANSPREMLLRLENMVLSSGSAPPLKAIRNLISSAVQIIIQTNRFDMKGEGNSRRMTSIAEIVGMDEDGEEIILEPVFEFVGHPEDPPGRGGFHAQTGYLPTFWRDLSLFQPTSRVV